jgi:hypothetical protein
MPCSSHPWLHYCDYTWRKIQVMKLLIMQFSLASCHFIPLRCKYFPQHPILKHPQQCSSLTVQDQVSHPYRTTSKIIVSANYTCWI